MYTPNKRGSFHKAPAHHERGAGGATVGADASSAATAAGHAAGGSLRVLVRVARSQLGAQVRGIQALPWMRRVLLRAAAAAMAAEHAAERAAAALAPAAAANAAPAPAITTVAAAAICASADAARASHPASMATTAAVLPTRHLCPPAVPHQPRGCSPVDGQLCRWLRRIRHQRARASSRDALSPPRTLTSCAASCAAASRALAWRAVDWRAAPRDARPPRRAAAH